METQERVLAEPISEHVWLSLFEQVTSVPSSQVLRSYSQCLFLYMGLVSVSHRLMVSMFHIMVVSVTQDDRL